MTERLDEEGLDAGELAALQDKKLRALLARNLPANPFYQQKFAAAGCDPMNEPIGRWPLTTRSEIEADQGANPPYGTNLSEPLSRYTRLHQTSGTAGRPLRWLDTPESWGWFKRCWSMVFRGAGLRAEDRVVFPFSFGPFIGFWGAFEAAIDLGNFVLPAGGMTTTGRLGYILENGATVVCCTPTYALRLEEVAQAEGFDLAGSAVRLLIVAGEPGGSVASVRSRIESAFAARVIDHVGMTEMGAYGFECVESPGGMHVIESEFIAEVIDPASGRAVAEGQAGELVLTNLGRMGSPLLRYRTGDRVTMSRKPCACGRRLARLAGGVSGRIDDMLVIRGNNVFPSAVEEIVRGFREVAEYRLTVVSSGTMNELRIDVEPHGDGVDGGLADRIAARVRDRLNFRPTVVVVPAGALPRFELKARRLVRESESK